MTRRRWIYIKGEALEVSEDYAQPLKAADNVMWNDRLYQDDKDQRYASRSQHREFMKRNGLTTMDDYKGTWEKDASKRTSTLAGKDPTRIRDVVEAFNKLSSRRH